MSDLGSALRRSPPARPKSRIAFTVGLFLVCALFVVMQIYWIRGNKDLFKGGASQDPARGANDAEFVPCYLCRTQGKVTMGENGSRPLLCPLCFGVGGHYVIRESESDVNCPRCRGLGQWLDRETRAGVACGICGGRGIKELAPGHMFCPECGGGGSFQAAGRDTPDKCWLCDGSGMIMKEAPSFPR